MNAPITKRVVISEELQQYPETDGEPLGESSIHFAAIRQLVALLEMYFNPHGLHCVAGDLFWYWDPNKSQARLAPDVMVVKNAGNQPRYTFLAWKEQRTPSVIVEVLSLKTWDIDMGDKRDKYAALGVTEYFLFDPEGDFLDVPVWGLRLNAGKYERMAHDAQLRVFSTELNLYLSGEGWHVRLWDGLTGGKLLTAAERAEQERERAEQERQRVEQALAQLEQERQRADRAERELRELRAQQRQTQDQPEV